MAAILDELPGAMVVECSGDPMDTFRRTLIAEPHWHLEDDVILAHDFQERAAALVESHGNMVIRGFSTTGYPGGLVAASSYLYNQCTWLPSGYGPLIADFLSDWRRLREHPTGFDLVIRDFLVSRREKYWLETPSLVQHARGKSLLGPRSSARRSPTFDDYYGGE